MQSEVRNTETIECPFCGKPSAVITNDYYVTTAEHKNAKGSNCKGSVITLAEAACEIDGENWYEVSRWKLTKANPAEMKFFAKWVNAGHPADAIAQTQSDTADEADALLAEFAAIVKAAILAAAGKTAPVAPAAPAAPKYDANDAANDLSDTYRNRAPEGPGVFERDGTTYRVVKARGGDNLYAKVLRNGEFVYEAGAYYKVREIDRIGMDRAVELSAELHSCAICGRTLTDPNSVAAGIGPICAEKIA